MALQFLLTVFIFAGCGNNQQSNDKEPVTIAKVQVTHINYKTLADTLTVNGMVLEGQQFMVRAPVTGYVTKLMVRPGDQLRAGQPMFAIKTRELAALAGDTAGTTLPAPDAVIVKAPVAGQVNSISTGDGVYTAEGSAMATLNSQKNLYVKLYIPEQWSNLVQTGDSALVQWANGQTKWTRVGDRLAQADSQSQSMLYMITDLPPKHLLPGERLTVQIPVNKMVNEQVLPRNAVLTDESMTSYWVMKMINDSIAVRVPVIPGITAGNWIAVRKPRFKTGDRILVAGNYGLPDTARVTVTSNLKSGNNKEGNE